MAMMDRSPPLPSSSRLPPPPPYLRLLPPQPTTIDTDTFIAMYHEPQGTEPQWTLRQVKSTPRPIHGHDAASSQGGGGGGPAPPQPLPRILAPPDSQDPLHIAGTHARPPSNSGALNALLLLLLATILLLFLQQPRIRRKLSHLTHTLRATLGDVWRGYPVLFRPDIIALRALRYATVGDAEALIEPNSLHGQTIFISGASGGIGFEMLVECVGKGGAGRVIAGVRGERGEEVVKRRLRMRMGDEQAEEMLRRITFVTVEYDSLQDACDGAGAILDAIDQDIDGEGQGRLDAYINTVGVGWLPPDNRQKTTGGVEWLMGINAVNPLVTLLVVLAAQRRRKRRAEEVPPPPPPKVIFFSSLSHVWLGFKPARYAGGWERVVRDQEGRAWLSRYGHSKLTQLLLLRSLSPLLSLTEPIHAVNPGECNTPFVDTLCVWLVTRPTTVATTTTPTTSSSSSLSQQQIAAQAWAKLKLAYYRWQHWFNCKSLTGALWRRWCTLRPLDGANVGLAALNYRHHDHRNGSSSSSQGVSYWCYDFWNGARQGSMGTVAMDEVVRREAWALVRGTLLEFFAAGRVGGLEEGVRREVVEMLLRGGDEWGQEGEESSSSSNERSTDAAGKKDV